MSADIATPDSGLGAGSSPSPLFAVGDWVRISPHGQWDYEVAEIKMYPHGPMIGIYDEPPSKHVDFWNPSSLTLTRKANV